jgi:hypothetical protein
MAPNRNNLKQHCYNSIQPCHIRFRNILLMEDPQLQLASIHLHSNSNIWLLDLAALRFQLRMQLQGLACLCQRGIDRLGKY